MLFFTTPYIPMTEKEELRAMFQIGLWSYQGGCMMEIRSFSKRQKEKDKIMSWAGLNMVHHFVLENRNGKILARY